MESQHKAPNLSYVGSHAEFSQREPKKHRIESWKEYVPEAGTPTTD